MLYAKLFKAEHEPLQVRHETNLKNESEHAFPLKVPIIIPQKYVQGQLCCNIAWVQTSTSILVNVVLPTSQTFARKANPCRSVPYIYAIILTGATIYKMKKKRVHLSSYIPADTSSKFTMVLFQNFHTLMDNTPSMLPPLPFALTDGGEIN